MNDLIKREDALLECEALIPIDCKMMKKRINDIPSAEKQGEWIPCSERLPKLGEKVLVCTSKTCFTQVFKGIFSDPTRWHWENNTVKKVVAWMPLPEPMKGVDDE